MSEYVPQESLDGWIVAHDKQRARAEAAEAELERLHSWQGLLELLDEHWPDDIFPTLTDDAERDTGPRLVSALRRADKAERKVARVEALRDEAQLVPIHAGGGNLVNRVRMVSADELTAALADEEGDR